MKNLLYALFIFTFFISCNNDDETDFNSLNPSTYKNVLEGTSTELKALLNKVRGSVGKRSGGSITIWSRKNDYSLGLFIGALHSRNFGAITREQNFKDLTDQSENAIIGGYAIQIPPLNGDIGLGFTYNSEFDFYNPRISSDATNSSIDPSEDFYMGIMDNQQEDRTPGRINLGNSIKIDLTESLSIYDKDNRTIADVTWALPISGENAIAIGYPQDATNYPEGAVIYGKILSDLEAIDIIDELQSANDEEGDLPYNPNVEFFIEGKGLAGMSGGGVFNKEGQLLGIIVRGSTAKEAPEIIRVVRIDYMKNSMIDFYNSLSENEKNKVEPFINGEL